MKNTKHQDPKTKERPILFSGPMVRAILDGRKTQTRRVVKRNASGRVELRGKQWHIEDENAVLACPYGQPGDRLWVKETFAIAVMKGMTVASTKPNDEEAEMLAGATHRFKAYRADGWEKDKAPESMKWRPSIFMPRWASRITLEIVGVRVERLQDITEEDARAEGVEVIEHGFYRNYLGSEVKGVSDPKLSYFSLWEAINGFGSWDANPWVWVVEFKRVKQGSTESRPTGN